MANWAAQLMKKKENEQDVTPETKVVDNATAPTTQVELPIENPTPAPAPAKAETTTPRKRRGRPTKAEAEAKKAAEAAAKAQEEADNLAPNGRPMANEEPLPADDPTDFDTNKDFTDDEIKAAAQASKAKVDAERKAAEAAALAKLEGKAAPAPKPAAKPAPAPVTTPKAEAPAARPAPAPTPETRKEDQTMTDNLEQPFGGTNAIDDDFQEGTETQDINNTNDIKDIVVFPGHQEAIPALAKKQGFFAHVPEHMIEHLAKLQGQSIPIRFLKIIKESDVKKGRANENQIGQVGYKTSKDGDYITFDGALKPISMDASYFWAFGVEPDPNIAPKGVKYEWYFMANNDDNIYIYTFQGGWAANRSTALDPEAWHEITSEWVTDPNFPQSFLIPVITQVQVEEEKDPDKVAQLKEIAFKYIARRVAQRKEKGIYKIDL